MSHVPAHPFGMTNVSPGWNSLPAPELIRNDEVAGHHETVFVVRIAAGLKDAGAALPQTDGEPVIAGQIADGGLERAIE